MSKRNNKKTFNMMLDPLFKAVARSTEARKMIASVVSQVTDIKKEDIINAKFVGGEIPKQRKYEKGKISDVIILLDNTIVILEMNMSSTGENFKKNITYAYSIYSQNVKRKNGKVVYPKLFLININNFNAYDTKEPIQYFDFKDQNEELEIKTGDGCKSIHLILANIIDTRYNKNMPESIIRYAKFLKAKSIEELRKIAKGDEEFMEAIKKVEELMQDEEFIGLYDKEERDLDDRLAAEQYNKKLGREQGKEEGIVIGRIEGREEGRIEGRIEGRTEGLEQGREQGKEEGIVIGRIEGREEGREEGQKEGLKTAICNMARHNIDIAQIATIMNLKQSEVSRYLQL